MPNIHEIKERLHKKIDKAGEYWIEKQPADMGNHSGVVEVPSTQNMIYARLANGQVIQAFNNVAPNIYNWKVFVGRDKSQPWLVKVIEVRWIYNISETIAYVLFHHKQHEYPAPDTVWIRRDQFMPLLVLPAGGFTINIYGDILYAFGMAAPVKVPDMESVDLSSHVISAGAKYVLLEVQPDGDLNYVTGTTYESLDVLYTQALPSPTEGSFPVCAFIFYDSQTELRRDSVERTIIDLRMFTTNNTPGAATQWHVATAKTTPADADEFGLWDTAESIIKKVTWANIKATLKTYFDTLYSVLGHVHAASTITNVPAGTIAATDVQTALNELDTEKSGTAHTHGYLADTADYDDISANDAATDVTGAELEELTDGSTTVLHAHSGGSMPNPFALTADISPAALTADVDDYNPTGLSTTDVLRLTTDGSDYNVNGLAGGADGRVIIILNVSAGSIITLVDEALTSAAGNRFSLTANIRLFPHRGCVLIYDATLSRWREVASTDAATVQGALFSANLGSAVEGHMLVFTADGSFESMPAADAVTGYMEEAIQDMVGAMFSSNTETGITATYEDSDGTIDLVVSAGGLTSGPQAFGDNYVITPSVAANDLTLALKTVAGADPSAGDPITFRIGNTKRTITAALSVTIPDGTNWCNLGSTEHATQDIDLFPYLIQETGASAGTKIGFSRIPYARVMGDFVNTSDNEKYIAGNWTNFNVTDEVENIGRFNATLSGTAAFNWSIPATPIVINRPIFETRRLVCNSVWVGWTTPPTVDLHYFVRGDVCFAYVLATNLATSNSTATTETLPFACATITGFLIRNSTSAIDNGILGATPCMATIASADNKIVFYKDFAATAWTNSGNKQIFSTELFFPLR